MQKIEKVDYNIMSDIEFEKTVLNGLEDFSYEDMDKLLKEALKRKKMALYQKIDYQKRVKSYKEVEITLNGKKYVNSKVFYQLLRYEKMPKKSYQEEIFALFDGIVINTEVFFSTDKVLKYLESNCNREVKWLSGKKALQTRLYTIKDVNNYLQLMNSNRIVQAVQLDRIRQRENSEFEIFVFEIVHGSDSVRPKYRYLFDEKNFKKIIKHYSRR